MEEVKIDGKWYVRYDDGAFLRSLTLSGNRIKDALRAYFQPTKTEDPRLDFYTMYKRGADKYDTDHVRKYDEDLNITLVFVRPLLSPSLII